MSWCRVCGRYHLFGATRLHESRAKPDGARSVTLPRQAAAQRVGPLTPFVGHSRLKIRDRPASGITSLAPTSVSSADATVTVHRLRTVSSTSSTGPSKLTRSRTLVRASRSRARTAEAASAVGGGPLTPIASTSGSPADSGHLLGDGADQERVPIAKEPHPSSASRPVADGVTGHKPQ